MFIAEIGINHNGSLDTAFELIKQAKEAGADVVKFQKRTPEICVPEEQKNVIKESSFGTTTYLEYKKLMEFEKEEFDKIDAFCKGIGIQWTASVWDIPSVEFLMQYDVPFIKIPSALMTHTELLQKVNEYKKPVIISNGALTDDELDDAVMMLEDCEITILICNSSYPSNDNELNLNYLKTLKDRYSYCTIGYSGHELDMLPTLVAKSMGCDVIERHITLDKEAIGSDHKASLNIPELKALIQALARIDIIKGDNIKIVSEAEEKVMKKLRYYVK